MVVIVYFGVFRRHPRIGSLFLALAAAFFWTTPNRWGVGIALHYVSRALSAIRTTRPRRQPRPLSHRATALHQR